MLDRMWRTKDGRLLRVSQMDTAHIMACIRLIQKRQGKWRADYLDRLNLELDIRRLQNK